MATKSVSTPNPININTQASTPACPDVCPPVCPVCPPLPAKRGLRLKEAADYSGLTEWFLRKLCWDRKIEFVQSGKAYIVLRDDLDKYLEKQRYAVRA